MVLAVLSSVENNSMITQRTLAQELNIALGLANSYLKRCVKKGLIKIAAVPPRRYAYYLTPRGFTEKSALTAEYLRSSFNFFRMARSQCNDLLERFIAIGHTHIVLVGAGELAEIALLSAREHHVVVAAVVDPTRVGHNLQGHTVVADMPETTFHAALLVDLEHPQASYHRLCDMLPAEQVLVPALLRLSRNKPVAEDAP